MDLNAQLQLQQALYVQQLQAAQASGRQLEQLQQLQAAGVQNVDWSAYQVQTGQTGQTGQQSEGGKGKKGPVQEEGDWPCPSCGNINFRRREQCNRCGAPRPPEYSGKGKKGKGKGKGKKEELLANSSNIYITGLPVDWTTENIDSFFSQFGTIISSRILPVQPGKPTAAGFVRMSSTEAEWLVSNLDSEKNQGYVATGLTGPINLAIVEESEKGKGKGKKGNAALMEIEVNETDNLYVKGLPGDLEEERFGAIFSQYGVVTQFKLLPSSKLPGKTTMQQSGFVRYNSTDEARSVIALLHNKVPNGLMRPVQVSFAGDGVPQVKKMAAKMEAGEEVKFGVIRSYHTGHESGFIVVPDIYRETGQEVYSHKTVMDRCKAGPGDTVMFFLFWKGDKPQASNPMVRIGADQTEGGTACALRGWYKGIVKDKEFGFIESADLKVCLAKDVYVNKDLAAKVNPGWVSFNCTLQKDVKDGKLSPIATYVENCEETWKPSPGDLSKTREIGAKGGGKGNSDGDEWAMDKETAEAMQAMIAMVPFGGWAKDDGGQGSKGIKSGKGGKPGGKAGKGGKGGMGGKMNMWDGMDMWGGGWGGDDWDDWGGDDWDDWGAMLELMMTMDSWDGGGGKGKKGKGKVRSNPW